MPRFAHETKRIEADWWAKEIGASGESEHVVVKKFSYGDRQHLAGAYLSVTGKGSASEMSEGLPIEAELDIGMMNLEILKAGIVAWTDQDGKQTPVTMDAIKALDERDAEFILKAINDLNPQQRRSEDDQENFRYPA